MVNNQAGLNDQAFLRLAVDESDGQLALVYYDTVADPGRLKTDLYMQTSSDDGITWESATKITSAQTDETAASADGNQYGDYIGLSGFAGLFFPAWTDRRNSGLEEIWSTRLFLKPGGPAITVNLQDGLEFGTVCTDPKYLNLEIFNVGSRDLSIFSVTRTAGSTGFAVLPNPTTPLALSPGDHVDFTIQFVPTTPGTPENATIRISSNDPAAPFIDLSATGLGGNATLVTAIANSGDLGSACLGSFAEEQLTINNTGTCPLIIESISSSSPEFMAPGVASYPLVVSSGECLEVIIRFQPTSFGPKSATITLLSNDPAGPHTVRVSGVAPAPRLALLIADAGNFGNVCVGSFADTSLMLSNSGRCTLSVTGIASSGSEFLPPHVSAYPIAIGAGASLGVPIRFQPASFGPKSATITITSDDPAGPQTIAVTGSTPSGKLAVTGSTCIGGVKACCLGERTISICNVGDCKLHVSSVAFKRKSKHWRLINNPFPATLHPGSCLMS